MAKVKSKGKKKQRPKNLGPRSKEALEKKTLNPFEVHVNRQKHEVLGRKVKNDRGLPGVARAKAMKKRKVTLLQEYRVQDKTNKFLDRRIGEKNRAMTGEDRIMARFTAERMKMHNKKAMFNLADDEVLTHHGQTLNEIEKFDDPRSEDEDEGDQGKLESSFVKNAHFGGGMFTKASNPQSRKDLIEQLIAESKKRKAEQKMFREQTQELTDKLDTEWKDLLPIISTSKKKPGEDYVTVDRPDEYDTMIRELKFEARGKATDRLKSEEEIALEEKEQLEKLEADRLKRMHGITETDKPKPTHRSADDLDDGFAIDSDEEAGVVSYGADGMLEQSHPSQDKGDENMETDEEKGKNSSSSEDDDEDDNDDDNDDQDEEEDDDLQDLKSESENESPSESPGNVDHFTSATHTTENSEVSTCGLIFPDPDEEDKIVSDEEENNLVLAEEEEVEVEECVPVNKCTAQNEKPNLVSSRKKLPAGLKTEKPSERILKIADSESQVAEAAMEVEPASKTFEESSSAQVQSNHEEIKKDLLARKLMMDMARKELPYTFKVPENYEELQELLVDRSPEYQSVIMERIIKCTHPSLADGNKDKLATLLAFLLQHLHDKASQENSSDCFTVLDRLAPHFYDLAIIAPGNTRRCVAEVLKEKQNDYRSQRRVFPAQDTLVFFKLVSLLFPTSDYRHPVVTPTFVFMGQMLNKCRVKTRQDVAAGLYIATLVLEYTVLSKRFCPAVVTFLLGLLRSAMPASKTAEHLLTLPSDFTPSSKVGNLSLKELSSEQEIDDSFRHQALSHTVKLLEEFCTNLNDLPACFQIFQPITVLKPKYLPITLRKQVKTLQSTVKAMGSKSMPKLVPEAKKPKLLRLYEPSFGKVYDGKKFKVMGRERQERAKLMHKVKRETKGAMREIRRDKTFIAKLKIKQTMQSDSERRAKVREIFGSAATQQGELRALERKKK